MKYLKFFIILIITISIDAYLLISINKNLFRISIDDITITDELDDSVDIKVAVKTKSENFKCILKANGQTEEISNNKKECITNIKLNTSYTIQVVDEKGNNTKETSINKYLGYILNFQFENNKIYLVPEEEYDLNYKKLLLTDENINLNFEIEDNSIVELDNNKIIAKKVGETTIKSDYSNEDLKIVVTDLIHAPKAEGKNKKVIPCNVYSEEESKILEDILDFKVKEAGESTRAGAVAAARFLTLEFEYRIPYFYENGRINDTGVHKADGEGRYYHKGLYLTESKFKDIKYTWANKATWGCPLKNFETLPSYGYTPGKMMPNGLDCSGFVTWALYNGGFDPGDVGAGETPREGQCTDLGKFTPISRDLFKSGKARTGDLINFFGHIGMIISIDLDKNEIIIAESLPNLGGAIARTYTLEKLVSLFTHVVLMDDYYKEDGKYTQTF